MARNTADNDRKNIAVRMHECIQEAFSGAEQQDPVLPDTIARACTDLVNNGAETCR